MNSDQEGIFYEILNNSLILKSLSCGSDIESKIKKFEASFKIKKKRKIENKNFFLK